MCRRLTIFTPSPQFKEPTCKALGSSLKLLMVAEGEAHICEWAPRLLWLVCDWSIGLHVSRADSYHCLSINGHHLHIQTRAWPQPGMYTKLNWHASSDSTSRTKQTTHTLIRSSEWDTCAAHAVVEAAGGKVLQAAGGVRRRKERHRAAVFFP